MRSTLAKIDRTSASVIQPSGMPGGGPKSFGPMLTTEEDRLPEVAPLLAESKDPMEDDVLRLLRSPEAEGVVVMPATTRSGIRKHWRIVCSTDTYVCSVV